MHARTDANKHKVNISYYSHRTDGHIANYQKYSIICCHQTIKNYEYRVIHIQVQYTISYLFQDAVNNCKGSINL